MMKTKTKYKPNVIYVLSFTDKSDIVEVIGRSGRTMYGCSVSNSKEKIQGGINKINNSLYACSKVGIKKFEEMREDIDSWRLLPPNPNKIVFPIIRLQIAYPYKK